MNDIVIKAENLGKMYTIGHQAERGGYTALRDVLMQNARILWNKAKDLARGKAIIQGDTTEEVWALKDVSFEIRRGEAVGIIGRNGAGKSTLLKILSRITEPSTGRVTNKGRVASLLEVGTGFHPEMSGRENIYMNGTILGMTRKDIKRKFDEIVAFAEVEKIYNTPVKRYSSGMYVRLAFAVAAHLEPEILVVDEVLAVGDAAFQKKCLGKMGDVAKGGRTILFVSHNMGAIRSLCERVIWLNDGRIVAEGETESIVERYFESATESLVGNSQAVHPDFQGLVIEKILLKDIRGKVTNSFKSGSNIVIELHYNALNHIKKPYFWIGVQSSRGPLFGANMLFDDLRPDYIEGKGVVSCVFKNLRLLPQMYSVSFGARDQNGMKFLVPTITNAALFQIVGKAMDLGLRGELADLFLENSSPMLVPYEWNFMDGQVATPDWIDAERK